MTKETSEINPYRNRNRQKTVYAIDANRERIQWINNHGQSGEGKPEDVLLMLETNRPHYLDKNNRTREEGLPIVIAINMPNSAHDLIHVCDARHWTGTRGIGKGDVFTKLTHNKPENGKGLEIYRSQMRDFRYNFEVGAQMVFDLVAYCNQEGVIYNGSAAGAAFSLFRKTLKTSLKLWSPINVREASYSGRREYYHEPRQWEDMVYCDIKAAYPFQLIQGVPTRWTHRSHPINWRDYPDGYGMATVEIPEDCRPLPCRLRRGTRKETTLYLGGGIVTGIWPIRDLLRAEKLGCKVSDPIDVWKPQQNTDVFASPEWMRSRSELRQIGPIGKIADNGLLGIITTNPDGIVTVQWKTPDGKDWKTTPRLTSYSNNGGLAIGVVVTARVREVLSNGIEASNAIYCDTDGLITTNENMLMLDSLNNRPKMGDWAVKQQFAVIDIKTVQQYRYKDYDDLEWNYLGNSKREFDSVAIDDTTSITIREAQIRGLM